MKKIIDVGASEPLLVCPPFAVASQCIVRWHISLSPMHHFLGTPSLDFRKLCVDAKIDTTGIDGFSYINILFYVM
jgi:hypothetical protein